jgi:hypothetical protein
MSDDEIVSIFFPAGGIIGPSARAVALKTAHTLLKAARLRWIPVAESLPEEREQPYQVIVACVKTHGEDTMYAGRGMRRFMQDWVVRRWPQNFTHWMEAPPWPES